jgi:UDP-N-acetylglucosamine 1-carboxyvinyltransferase
MEHIVVHHRGPLSGEVTVPGAKNSVLKLMAATLLADGEYRLTNVPDISDVAMMADLLAALGVSATWQGPGQLTMRSIGAEHPVAPYDLVERIRASVNVLGPLMGRYGHVRLSMPGGDDFG